MSITHCYPFPAYMGALGARCESRAITLVLAGCKVVSQGKKGEIVCLIACWQTAQKGLFNFRIRQLNSGR
jgi:hypothetical protein